MNRATPQIRDFAGRLIAYDAREIPASAPPVAFPVPERLRPYLATLMGNGGYRALLLRSLALASAEVSWLGAAQVAADGTLEGFDELEAQVDLGGIAGGRVALVAQLIGLLVAFIGEKLTMQLVREVWPSLPPEDLNFSKGDRT